MAKLNVPKTTHEGARVRRISTEQELRRSVMSCLLWEDTFYEDGVSIAERIKSLIPKVKPIEAWNIAVESRSKMKLRHIPLLITREMARIQTHKSRVDELLFNIVQRPDELAEFLAIYWSEGKEPLSAKVKKGLARAFTKFNAYQLAKYNSDKKDIKLRDVLFLSHAKPISKEQEEVWRKLVDGTLESPDTWEVNLSAGKDKKETWERLLKENKLGALALLRNLRNLERDGVEESLVKKALAEVKVERVLPFRFITAARYAPNYEENLEKAMFRCLEGHEKLASKTVLLVDVSGSMDCEISGKSEVTRIEAACGVAILAREICEDIRIFTFSDNTVEVPSRRGFALRDAIVYSQFHRGTQMGKAIRDVYNKATPDRLIVITDEQSHDRVPSPKEKGYIINVASYQNGVGYGPWTHIDGWSEAVIQYIQQYEDFERNLV